MVPEHSGTDLLLRFHLFDSTHSQLTSVPDVSVSEASGHSSENTQLETGSEKKRKRKKEKEKEKAAIKEKKKRVRK